MLSCHACPTRERASDALSGSARRNHQHLMRQEGWLQAEDSRLWDMWRHRTRGSAAAPSGGRGGSGPLPERGAEILRLDDSGLLEVRLPLVAAQVCPAEVRELSAGVRTRGPWLPLLSAFVLIL